MRPRFGLRSGPDLEPLVNHRILLLGLGLSACTAPQADPQRPDLGSSAEPFANDGEELVSARSVVTAHVDSLGVRVDGPWDTVRLQTVGFGRETLQAVRESAPVADADGYAVADRGGIEEFWGSAGEDAV